MGRRSRRGGRQLDGLLLVDKPAGLSSFAVVARVRRLLNVGKVGHTGTLDPFATGLLPICLGQATKLASYLSDANKGYTGVVRLGVSTTTLDPEGEIIHEDDPELVKAVDDATFRGALEGFRGVIEQRPPAFSAIKVDGERLYAKARRGEVVEAPLRQVTIHELALTNWASPEFTIDVLSSKGTYIRSLALDIGGALGLGAHLTGLRRTSVGRFSVEHAITLDEIEADVEAAVARVLTPADAVAHLPAVALAGEALEDVRQGRKRPFPDAPVGVCRALDPSGRLVAIIQTAGVEPAKVIRGFPAAP